MKFHIKEYIIISIGVIIMTLGLNFFLVPANLAVGGIVGFAMVLNKIIPVSIGAIMVVMNVFLFIIAFILIGGQFGAKTIYTSFLLSGAMWIFEKYFYITNPLTNDMFLNLFFGILIQGIGMAVIFYQNASTGGTDIVAKILNKFFHIDIGKALLLADFFITLMAGVTFGIELGLYALLGVILNAFVIDNVIEGLGLKINVSVVTCEIHKVIEFINKEMKRGSTVYEGYGAYTKEKRLVINSVMNKREFIKLKKYVKEVDDRAFLIASNVREVLGKGFEDH